MYLQDLPLEILIEISKVHPWTACELSKTIRKVGHYSLENDVKRWFKREYRNDTFIRVKSSNVLYYEKLLPHSWDDNPALSYPYGGGREWYKEGRLHRDNDKPARINCSGSQTWYKEDKMHRDNDKPAVISFDQLNNGLRTQVWCIEGKRHRDRDLPAVVCDNGNKEWWKGGERYYLI